MQHSDLINHLAHDRYRRYLEIGVESGVTYKAVNIEEKTAVDPFFKVPTSTLSGRVFSLNSDAFFARDGNQYDCIFLDGLHVYEQIRRDFLNSWGRLSPNGVVLIDDCIPSDDLAAGRDHHECIQAKIARGDPDRNWMGDVYKLVVWINDFTDYSFCHVAGTQGVVAVWGHKTKRAPWIGDEDAIARLSYDRFKAFPLPTATADQVRQRVGHDRPNVFSELRRIFR